MGYTAQDLAAQDAYDVASERLFTWLSRSVTGVAATIGKKYDAKPDGSRLADGAGAYLELKEIYELQGDDQIASLQEQFHSITMGEGEDPDMPFTNLEQIVLSLEGLGVDVGESSVKAAAIRALPSAYRPLVVILRTTPTIIYRDMKSRVRVYYRNDILPPRRKARP